MTRITSFGEAGAASCPQVSRAEWALSLGSVACAGLAYLFGDSYSPLVFATVLMITASLGLVALAAVGMIRSALMGRFLLSASVTAFFWLEAAKLAFDTPVFRMDDAINAGGQFAPSIIRQTLLYVSLFQLMLFVGYSLRAPLKRLSGWVAERVDSTTGATTVVALLAAAASVVPSLYLNQSISGAAGYLLASRTVTGLTATDFPVLQYFAILGVYGTALLVAKALVGESQPLVLRLIAGAFGVLAMLPYALSGTRHMLLFTLLPSIVLLLRQAKARMSAKRAIRWLLLGAVLIIGAQLQLALRDAGWTEITHIKTTSLTNTNVLFQFTALMYAEKLVPNHHNYFHESTIPFFLTYWIPRHFWKDKPVMESWAYYNDLYTGGSAVWNVTPSAIGQFHMNWGPVGVLFIGIWLGWLTRICDQLLSIIDIKRQLGIAVVIGLFYAFIISSFRYYSPFYLTFVLFGSVLMKLSTKRVPTRLVVVCRQPGFATNPQT